MSMGGLQARHLCHAFALARICVSLGASIVCMISTAFMACFMGFALILRNELSERVMDGEPA